MSCLLTQFYDNGSFQGRKDFFSVGRCVVLLVLDSKGNFRKRKKWDSEK